MRKLFLILLVGLTTTFGTCPAIAAVGQAPATDLDASALHSELIAEQGVLKMIRDGDLAGANARLPGIISADAFQFLPLTEKHRLLFFAGTVARELKDPKSAHSYFVRSSVMDGSIAEDWYGRLHSAFDNKDMADAGFALTAIAQRYPGDLRQRINRDAVYLLVDAAKNNDGPGDRWFRLLDALFDAHWAYTEGIEPSWLWCDLARLELERNMPDRVSEIAARITSPEALISLRVDKQFAPLVKARPERFDIEHAAAAEVEVLRGFVAKAPRSLGALVDLSASMLVSRQFAEALRITDEAIARVAAAQGAPAPYDDVDAMFIWVMDERAGALQHLNRWPEALEQLRLAAALPESGMTNISLAINAADSCIALERADEALALVEHLREPTPFGRMQVESIRFSAALQKGDEAESDRALAYMSEHRVDAIEAYQDALLEADRIDSAAAVLIARLNDSKERSAALVNVQIYPESPAPSRIIEQRRRFHELLMRADVRATIGRFGIVESFSVSP